MDLKPISLLLGALVIALVVEVLPERATLTDLVLQFAGLGGLIGVAIGRLGGSDLERRAWLTETCTVFGAAFGAAAFVVGATFQGLS